ncbi:MAG: peptidylprolyl isomerase [Thermodesulfovibrionales bacterium]|nr:peptidylprolyl isomerase [Thermodesulfovibrionales bacterium]
MKKAGEGDTVKVHYTGKLDDGTVFDSSVGREPLEFTMGAGMMISGFERAVEGMAVGETTSVNILPEDAYGVRRDDMVVRVGRKDFPENITPEVGVAVTMQHPESGQFDAMISEVTEEAVMLDANHPLAGKSLNFDIEVLEIS